MKLLDKLKDTLSDKMAGKPAAIHVCMMGARGVGKTSVLTSMFHNLNAVNADTNLHLVPQKDPHTGNSFTQVAIEERYIQLLEMFHDAFPGKPINTSGIGASFDVREYYFMFGVKGRKPELELQIKDFPGEYIRTQPQNVIEYIRESTALLVAVDTPHLMECDGQFCEAKNSVSQITDLFKMALDGQQDEKLVLFVPLKCEKYSRDGNMQDVTQAVEQAYADLIGFIKSGKGGRVVCAITPILTVGDVVFKEFLQENGSVKTVGEEGLPAEAVYVYANGVPGYHPRYCEQPLCYLLSFVSRLYERQKSDSDGSFLKKMAAIFKLFPEDPTLLLEINRFSRKMVRERDGYKVVTGKGFI